jgi:hypothetical protein
MPYGFMAYGIWHMAYWYMAYWYMAYGIGVGDIPRTLPGRHGWASNSEGGQAVRLGLLAVFEGSGGVLQRRRR